MILSRHYNQRHIALYIFLMIKKISKEFKRKTYKKNYHLINYQQMACLQLGWSTNLYSQ